MLVVIENKQYRLYLSLMVVILLTHRWLPCPPQKMCTSLRRIFESLTLGKYSDHWWSLCLCLELVLEPISYLRKEAGKIWPLRRGAEILCSVEGPPKVAPKLSGGFYICVIVWINIKADYMSQLIMIFISGKIQLRISMFLPIFMRFTRSLREKTLYINP